MPKPTRRERRLGKYKGPRRPVIVQQPRLAAAVETQTAVSPSPSPGISPREYDYVYHDLRRIAILAVIMFSVLFALSFILNQ